MLANSASYIPIDTADLAPYLEKASRRLAQVKHTPKINMAKGEEPPDGSPRWRESTMGSATADTLSLMSTAKKLSRDPLLLSDAINHAMTTVRRGLQIGMHLSRPVSSGSVAGRGFCVQRHSVTLATQIRLFI